MRVRRLPVNPILAAALCVLSVIPAGLGAENAPPARGGITSITTAELIEWLSYLASDQLEGREVYTEGMGLAAAYIANHLAEWGIKPAGDAGTYFQSVKVIGVRTTSRASVTVDVNGRTRTFKDGEGITFPANMGANQSLTSDQIQFAGYGLKVPWAGIDDYATVDPKGKIVIYLGQEGPKALPPGSHRLLGARARNAVGNGALAVIGPPARGRAMQATGTRDAMSAGGRGGFNAPPDYDFMTVQRYDQAVVPTLAAQDDFFEFLFSGSGVKYAELKDKASNHEPLPSMVLKGVKLTVNVDADYAVVNTRFTRNVVGTIPGTDRQLQDTYVAFGAHYDHVGYVQGASSGRGCQTADAQSDRICNGADDDGSGTVALMAIAKAFALGPTPKRSLLFVWHAGEEAGLLGSRYNADFPVVPNAKIVAQLNIDMIGRNRNDKPEEANTVYIVGADRISTELHNVNEDANASLPKPLTLSYEMNDPADPESIYTRSDHYSYALKGIPIVFFTTGLHKDYHRVTDSVEKIEFPKLALITQLVYSTGLRLANLDHAPVRDNKGPRKGKGASGRIDIGH